MRFHGNMRVNEKGHLEIGGCDTVDLARKFGTPLWVMDEDFIRQQCRDYKRVFIDGSHAGDVAYASKAFLTMAMAAIVMEEGLSLDIVSAGELYTALKVGFPPERIYFHGNNKGPGELEMAVEFGVGRIVVDNFYELELLEKTVNRLTKGPVPIMLRLTPGVAAHTHEYIRTGQEDSKFGFSLSGEDARNAVQKTLEMDTVTLKGIHCHIGSQIFETDSFGVAAGVMMDFIGHIYKEEGYFIEELNLGGGFGIYYSEGDAPIPVEKYAETIISTVCEKASEYDIKVPKIIVEPGRSIVGPAGTTLYTVGSIKDIPGIRKYAAVDGGMSDNIRPALYQAEYEAAIANKADRSPDELVSIAGKCCESGDMLIWNASLPEIKTGDVLAVFCTGAYGYSMSNNYNRLGRPAMVLVSGGQAELIVRRETYDDLLRNELLPKRLAKNASLTAASSV